jgi:hypothetical protein
MADTLQLCYYLSFISDLILIQDAFAQNKEDEKMSAEQG